MPYIGAKELKASDIRRFDVTSSTSATHTLTWTPPTEQSLIVTINGIKQHEDAYSVSGTTLTLSSPLVATDKLEVIGINDIGTTITPAQNSVDTDKIVNNAVTSAKLDTNIAIDGDLTVDTNTLHVDSTNNRVGIGTASPAQKLDVVGKIRTSAGILFGTDTASANTLDDYEEGTFTPTWAGSSSNPTPTYTDQTGRYIKVGTMVFFTVSITTSASSGGSGTLLLSNLPFTATGTWQSILVGYGFGITALIRGSGYTNPNSANMVLGASSSNSLNISVSQLSTSTTHVMVSGTYVTS